MRLLLIAHFKDPGSPFYCHSFPKDLLKIIFILSSNPYEWDRSFCGDLLTLSNRNQTVSIYGNPYNSILGITSINTFRVRIVEYGAYPGIAGLFIGFCSRSLFEKHSMDREQPYKFGWFLSAATGTIEGLSVNSCQPYICSSRTFKQEDIVKVTFYPITKRISFVINDQDQEICIEGVSEKELYPAVIMNGQAIITFI